MNLGHFDDFLILHLWGKGGRGGQRNEVGGGGERRKEGRFSVFRAKPPAPPFSVSEPKNAAAGTSFRFLRFVSISYLSLLRLSISFDANLLNSHPLSIVIQ